MNTHFTPYYVHCPRCGHLDRHFADKVTSFATCANCHHTNRICFFNQPERTEEWVAQKLRGEISIVQKKDLLGRISMGWFSETKILIAETKDSSGGVSPLADEIMGLAEIEAKRRNSL